MMGNDAISENREKKIALIFFPTQSHSTVGN
jgi:hypothetical protein